MTPDERKQMIIDWLTASRDAHLISEVGRGVGLRVTPYLRSLLADLVDSGWVYARMAMHPRYGWSRFYQIVEFVEK